MGQDDDRLPIEPQAPTLFRNILWVLLYGRQYWWLILIGLLVVSVPAILPYATRKGSNPSNQEMTKKRSDGRFDVFLSHNSAEKDAAIMVAERLRDFGLSVWVDAWELRPGQSWQQGLQNGLKASDSCAVLIGKSGFGGWHRKETEAALLRQGTDYPVIPVLLPGAPERSELDAFLSLLTWVDYRQGLDNAEATNRLIWGITGLRPDELTITLDASSVDISSSQFIIQNPKNGDLLHGLSKFTGVGPPNQDVFLHYRASRWKEFQLGSSAKTDEKGRWETSGPNYDQWFGEIGSLPSGPFEIYAAGVKNSFSSPLVTIFLRDSGNAVRIADGVRIAPRKIELSYHLYDAFIEATHLRRGHLIHSGEKSGLAGEVEALASDAGSEIAKALRRLVPGGVLSVHVSIDESGNVRLEPSTAWACFYAFPVPRGENRHELLPSNDFATLRKLRTTQMVWRLLPRVAKIPTNPFGNDFGATSTYLEIRHEGYRPEFVIMETPPKAQMFDVQLSPVLGKRIAVLGFPGIGGQTVAAFSQLISHKITLAIEKRPELGSFGYFSDTPAQDGERELFVPRGRNLVEIVNEVLSLDDVQAVEKELEEVDTTMVSGEGRHLKRKTLDIQYIVKGSYRLGELDQ